MNMHVERTTMDCLTPAVRGFWSQLQQTEPSLESPLFRPEFVEFASNVQNNVEIGLIYDAEALVGLFPYQRTEADVATPVGGCFSHYHGLIAPPELQFCPKELLRSCGLSAWHFSHLPQAQTAWQPFAWSWLQPASPFMDFSAGFSAFRKQQKIAHRALLEKVLRKGQRINREIGELRLISHTSEAAVCELLFDWKIAEYREQAVRNLLAPAWAGKLIEAFINAENEHFSGRLCALYAGERLAALNLCLKSGGVWHSLLSASNRQLSRYSPGLVLLAELAQQSERLGIRKIDLGPVAEQHEIQLSSGSTPLVSGSVDLRRLPNLMRRSFSRTREAVRSSPLGGQAQQLAKTARAWLLPG